MQHATAKKDAFFENNQLFHIFVLIDPQDMLKNGRQERAVIHLEMDGHHYYYGNLKALCDSWDKDEIGVAYNYLKNYGIDEVKPYVGKKCIIRKGTIVTSPRKTTEE